MSYDDDGSLIECVELGADRGRYGGYSCGVDCTGYTTFSGQ